MDQGLNLSFELLQRRLALMRDLANSLEQVQTAVVRSDLGGITGHTVRQGELCEALRQLESEAVPNRNPIGGVLPKRNIWARLPDDHLEVANTVRHCALIA